MAYMKRLYLNHLKCQYKNSNIAYIKFVYIILELAIVFNIKSKNNNIKNTRYLEQCSENCKP